MDIRKGDYITLKSLVYKIEQVYGDDFVIIIDGNSYWFEEKCIKDIYRLTKVK